MIIIELQNSTALGNWLTGLPHNKEGFSGGEFCLSFPTNTAKVSSVWCLEIRAGTLFLMLLKYGAVLSIICGFLMVVKWLERMPHTQLTPVRFQLEVLCCMSNTPLSPMFPICLLLNKGVYAGKKNIKKKTNLHLHWNISLLRNIKMRNKKYNKYRDAECLTFC